MKFRRNGDLSSPRIKLYNLLPKQKAVCISRLIVVFQLPLFCKI